MWACGPKQEYNTGSHGEQVIVPGNCEALEEYGILQGETWKPETSFRLPTLSTREDTL